MLGEIDNSGVLPNAQSWILKFFYSITLNFIHFADTFFFTFFLLKFRRRRCRKKSGFALDCVKLPSVTRLQLAWDSDNLTVIRVFTLHWNDSTGVQCCLRLKHSAAVRPDLLVCLLDCWRCSEHACQIDLCSKAPKLFVVCPLKLCELDHSYSQKNLQGVCSKM